MKIVAVSAAMAVGSLTLIWVALEVAGGYSVFPILAPFLFLPASALVLVLLLLASCFAIIVTLVALLQRRFGYAAILATVFCASWILSPWFLTRSAFLFGFAARLRHSSSPAEIQSASQLAVSLLPRGGRVFGPTKMVGSPAEETKQSQRAWDALSRYGFIHFLDDTCVISVKPPDVTFEWGGALSGHWGIFVLGSGDSTIPRYEGQSLRFSDRITLFRGE